MKRVQLNNLVYISNGSKTESSINAITKYYALSKKHFEKNIAGYYYFFAGS